MSTEEANKAAEMVGLNLLATLKNELGDLDRVKKVVKLVGFVNCVDGFDQQPAVINGCVSFFWFLVFGGISGGGLGWFPDCAAVSALRTCTFALGTLFTTLAVCAFSVGGSTMLTCCCWCIFACDIVLSVHGWVLLFVFFSVFLFFLTAAPLVADACMCLS